MSLDGGAAAVGGDDGTGDIAGAGQYVHRAGLLDHLAQLSHVAEVGGCEAGFASERWSAPQLLVKELSDGGQDLGGGPLLGLAAGQGQLAVSSAG